jgi:CheY-like chemotaxis protein
MEKKRKVLIVDDNEPNRKFVAETLEDEGYYTQVAASGEEALEIVKREEEPFDFVVTDRFMNGLDGVALANEAHARFKKVPKFILMTGTSITEEEAGPHILRIFHKPFPINTLVNFMRDLKSE